jgi:hypothetical protein
MNKTLAILIAVVALAALGLGAAGFVIAMRGRSVNAVAPGQSGTIAGGINGFLQRGQRGGFGMMNGRNDDLQPNQRNNQNRVDMQSYMLQAVADKLGMAKDDLNKELNGGKSLLDIAADKNMTVKDYNTMLTDARSAAIDQALADKVITSDQADRLKKDGSGFGLGGFGMRGLGCW